MSEEYVLKMAALSFVGSSVLETRFRGVCGYVGFGVIFFFGWWRGAD